METLTKLNDPTSEPKPIAIELAQVLTRVQVRRSSGFERIAPAGPSHYEIDEKLADRGYPARHRRRLKEGLHGPAIEKAAELLPRILAGDCLLLLLGDRGPGKTQMATWWAAERMRAGKAPGWYRKTADLISEIKVTWNTGGKSIGTEDDVLKKYRTAPFLALDEFHERGSSEWEARTLTNIIDHRYDNMLATVIIANMSEKEVRAQISQSIVSRAEETGGMVICDWPSYRQG
jgi:DNA replication protein DnaC